MFTVCPKCALTLVVTAADLRVAQGYVRCGRCSNVFNALNALSDERQAEPHPPPHETASRPRLEPAASPDPPAPQSAPPAPPDTPEQVAEFEEEFTAETALPPTSLLDGEEELEFDPTSTSVEEVFVEAPGEDSSATGTFESIVLEGGVTEEEIEAAEADEPDEPPPPDPDSELDQELLSLAKKIETQNRLPAPDFSSASQSIKASAAETLQELGITPGNDATADEDEEESSRVPIGVWRAGIAALLVLLIVQAIHHYRSDLAVIPQLSGPLTSIYDAVGVSLEPRWNVGAYEVRQLGAASDPAAPDKLVVRASIKNDAPLAQPLPLLRVAVQDRFGNRIASSDVAPAAYAPSASASHERLASGQRIDVEMRFVDPGTEAVGFEIDACLAAPGGGVNCANH